MDFNANEISPTRGTLDSDFSGDWKATYGRIFKRYEAYLVYDNFSTGTKATIPLSKINDLTLVDMCEKKISSVDNKYFSSYIGNAASPSYVYSTIYRGKDTEELVIYKY